MQSIVRCSIAVGQDRRPERRRECSRTVYAGPGRHVEFPCRCGGTAGRRRQTDPIHPGSRHGHPVPRLYVGRSLPGGRGYAAGDLQACPRHWKCRPRPGEGVPLRPGDAGRLANRVRPRRAGQDRQFLCAGGRQRPAAAAGAGAGGGRPHRLRAVAGPGEPARAEASDCGGQGRHAARSGTGKARRRPIRDRWS